MYKLLTASLFAGMICLANPVDPTYAAENTGPDNSVLVTVDQAKVFRIPRPAATIIVGNPAIVDATVEDEQTLVLTGRSFGCDQSHRARHQGRCDC